MAGPVRLGAGRNFDELQRQEVAAAAQVQERPAAAAAEPPPGRGRDRIEIEAKALDHGNLLAGRPVQIGIDQVAKVSLAAAQWFASRVKSRDSLRRRN